MDDILFRSRKWHGRQAGKSKEAEYGGTTTTDWHGFLLEILVCVVQDDRRRRFRERCHQARLSL